VGPIIAVTSRVALKENGTASIRNGINQDRAQKYKARHDASKHHRAWYKLSSMKLIRGEKGFRNRWKNVQVQASGAKTIHRLYYTEKPQYLPALHLIYASTKERVEKQKYSKGLEDHVLPAHPFQQLLRII
jgi:hypothetical protein